MASFVSYELRTNIGIATDATGLVADINGDGKDDLVLGESGPQIYLSMGRQGQTPASR